MGPLSGLSVVAHYVSPPYRTDRRTSPNASLKAFSRPKVSVVVIVCVWWLWSLFCVQLGKTFLHLNAHLHKLKTHWLFSAKLDILMNILRWFYILSAWFFLFLVLSAWCCCIAVWCQTYRYVLAKQQCHCPLSGDVFYWLDWHGRACIRVTCDIVCLRSKLMSEETTRPVDDSPQLGLGLCRQLANPGSHRNWPLISCWCMCPMTLSCYYHDYVPSFALQALGLVSRHCSSKEPKSSWIRHVQFSSQWTQAMQAAQSFLITWKWVLAPQVVT